MCRSPIPWWWSMINGCYLSSFHMRSQFYTICWHVAPFPNQWLWLIPTLWPSGVPISTIFLREFSCLHTHKSSEWHIFCHASSPNQWPRFSLELRLFPTKTISMVVRPPPQSTIEISFKTSTLLTIYICNSINPKWFLLDLRPKVMVSILVILSI